MKIERKSKGDHDDTLELNRNILLISSTMNVNTLSDGARQNLLRRRGIAVPSPSKGSGLGVDENSVGNIANETSSSSARNVSITKDESEGDILCDGFQSDSSSSNEGFVEPIVRKENGDDVHHDDDSWSSEFGECIDGALFR